MFIKNKILSLAFIVAASVTSNAYAAVPAAGSVIGNQATANYKDGSGQSKTATSNLVETTVATIAGVTIASSQNKTVSVGGTVLFQHTITNTGNSTDSFELLLNDLNSGNLTFTNLVIYPDVDQNGVPDSTTAMTFTPNISSGDTYGVIVSATIPNNATNGDNETISITAESVFNSGETASNTDTVNITGNAVIDVTKSLSISSGASPSTAPVTVTLTYTNTGDSNANTIQFVDNLPSGMTYVPNSANWSGVGSALTDTTGDNQSGMDYSMTGNSITAIIASISSGDSGTITFDVNIDSGVVPGSLTNFANITYDDGSGTSIGPVSTNGATYNVLQTALVAINDQNSVADEDATLNDIISITTPVSQGTTVQFDGTVINNGNGSDTFEVKISTTGNTFPVGTVFQFFKPDGVTPLADTNADGSPDTGVILAGAELKMVVKAILPTNFSGSAGYEFFTEVTSKFNNTVKDTVSNQLAAITSSTVDITNDTSVNGGANAGNGLGQGAETNAVRSITLNPSDTGNFSLFINNTSTIPDNYNLEISTDPTFATQTIPTGWTVQLRDGANIVSTTGNISANGEKALTLRVVIPNNATPITQSIYIRAISSITGAVDIIHQEVVVESISDLSITPNNVGQLFPAGTALYSHVINNNGNVTATSADIQVANTVSGWNAIAYYDQNKNGIQDAGEVSITNISQVAGGLAAGDNIQILVKVFAPSGASEGSVNTTTITIANLGGEINTSDNTASDVSTIIEGDVTLSKKQGLDADCNGIVDGSLTTGQISNAIPGACLVYEITATNTGSAAVNELFINDSTPSFTKYFNCGGSCAAIATVGVVTQPSSGSAGIVNVDVGSLNPIQTSILTFVVKIDEN
jgi:uncharacterized repeat protein (TIGR01451 family)